MKQLTREQTQSRKDRAVLFADNVLNDPDKASDIEDEDLESWAARHRIQITNARRNVRSMPRTSGGNGETKADLQDRIDELEAENEDLQSLLDSVYDLVSPGPDEDDEDVADDDDVDGQ